MAPWQVVDETVYDRGHNPLDNPFYGYRTTRLRLPDGRPATYHGILVGDIVHAVPVEADLTLHLIRQSRPNARAVGTAEVPVILELPGGAADPTRALDRSADDEICQEIGRRAGRMEEIGVLLPAVGISDERDTIFLATDLYPAVDPRHDEATEQDLAVVSAPFGRLYDQVRGGRVPVSAQTIAALVLAAAHL